MHLTAGEISSLVTAGVALAGALAAWLRANAAHAKATRALKRGGGTGA